MVEPTIIKYSKYYIYKPCLHTTIKEGLKLGDIEISPKPLVR